MYLRGSDRSELESAAAVREGGGSVAIFCGHFHWRQHAGALVEQFRAALVDHLLVSCRDNQDMNDEKLNNLNVVTHKMSV